MNPLARAVAALVLLIGWPGSSLLAQTKPDFSRWEKSIAAFEKRDEDKPPPKNAIVFAGSSSIVRWNVDKSFPGLDVVNRGFGGSQIADSVHFAPRFLLKLEPRLIVFYAGDNDLNAGKSPEQVASDFRELAQTVHKALPKTRMIYISIKPSLARWKNVEKVKQANTLIETYCKQNEGLMFLNVFPSMLGDDGKPKPELFVKDGLHMSDKGYEIWNGLLKPNLK